MTQQTTYHSRSDRREHSGELMVNQERQSEVSRRSQLATLGRRAVEAIGWFCIILGIAGAILPILPAWPFLLPGVLLLGPRNRRLRAAASRLRLALRHGSRHSNQNVRLVARLLAFQERTLRRSLSPIISRWANPNSSGIASSLLRYLVLLLPPAAIIFTIFLVIKLLAFIQT